MLNPSHNHLQMIKQGLPKDMATYDQHVTFMSFWKTVFRQCVCGLSLKSQMVLFDSKNQDGNHKTADLEDS